jgi:hypothetical protein
MFLDLQTIVIIHTSSSPDTISLERYWNAAQLGKIRLALHTSVRNRHNLLPKEIVLSAGGLKKIAKGFQTSGKGREICSKISRWE